MVDSKIALDKIKETEKKAEEIIEQAKGEAAHILRQATEERERILKTRQDQARLDAQKLKAHKIEETAEEIVLIEQRTQDEIKAIKEKAQGNLDRAVDFLKVEILRF